MAGNPCYLVDEALQFFDVDRIVVGNSPHETPRPLIMCGGKLVEISIGMSAWILPREASQPIGYVMRLFSADELLEQPVAPFFQDTPWNDKNSSPAKTLIETKKQSSMKGFLDGLVPIRTPN